MGDGVGTALALVVRKSVHTTACMLLAFLVTVLVARVTAGAAPVSLSLDSGHGASAAKTVAPTDPQARKLERLTRSFGCSRTGFGAGVIPLHAVVRQDGKVRLTSFDEGWAIHDGDAPGTLLSVCKR